MTLPKEKISKKLIYLDHAATTPVRAEVVRAMQPFWSNHFGNPSSLYRIGVEAKEALEDARSRIAQVLECRPQEVVFTAGGSESANLAILGAARAYRKAHKSGGHIVTSQIEHHAVLSACDALAAEGFTVTKIGVDADGLFNLSELKKSLRPDTILVSLMYANNEVGTIEPIREVAAMLRKENANRTSLTPHSSRSHPSSLTPILFHTDACQAAGYLDLNVQKLGVDLLTINASKIYGPKQVGALYVRKGVRLEPLVYGGGQERSMRSGTENVAGAVGFAKALELSHQEQAKEVKRLLLLQKYFIQNILKRVPGAQINGPWPQTRNVYEPLRRLPNNINVSFPRCEGEALLLYLDSYNVAASTGSACTSQSLDPSHVLLALGRSKDEANSSLRFTLGRSTSKLEIDYVLKALPGIVQTVQSMHSLTK
jgi:cysteine desulfurase